MEGHKILSVLAVTMTTWTCVSGAGWAKRRWKLNFQGESGSLWEGAEAKLLRVERSYIVAD